MIPVQALRFQSIRVTAPRPYPGDVDQAAVDTFFEKDRKWPHIRDVVVLPDNQAEAKNWFYHKADVPAHRSSLIEYGNAKGAPDYLTLKRPTPAANAQIVERQLDGADAVRMIIQVLLKRDKGGQQTFRETYKHVNNPAFRAPEYGDLTTALRAQMDVMIKHPLMDTVMDNPSGNTLTKAIDTYIATRSAKGHPPETFDFKGTPAT
jgi:hypothetical protein